MSKSEYLFEVLDEDGVPLKTVVRRCTNISAHEETYSLLEAMPEAAAVIGAEAGGHAFHAAYRE